jgi:hypothetical protein
MGLLLAVLIIFLLLGGAGLSLHGTLGTVLLILAVIWLLGGLGLPRIPIGLVRLRSRLNNE